MAANWFDNQDRQAAFCERNRDATLRAETSDDAADIQRSIDRAAKIMDGVKPKYLRDMERRIEEERQREALPSVK